MIDKRKAPVPLIAEIDAVIKAAAEAGLPATAAFLRLARLDLLLRAHGVTPGEVPPEAFARISAAGESPKPPLKRRKR